MGVVEVGVGMAVRGWKAGEVLVSAVGGLAWRKRMASTRMALKAGVGVVAVRVAKGEVIFVHWTVGWPMRTLPKARVLLGAVEIAVPVPLRETNAGEVPVPAATER